VSRIKHADLSYFQKKYYQPQNIVIAFCGNYDKAKIIKLLSKKIKKAALKPEVNAIMPAPLAGLHIKAESKDLEQSYLSLGFRGVSYLSPKRPIINLINVILGANMSSRLFDEIREKKALCYDISTSVAKYKDSGSFIIRLGLDKNKIDTAIAGILKELRKIKKELVPLQELTRAKDYFLGQTAMGLEHPVGRMFSFVQSYLTLGKIHIFNEIEKEVIRLAPKNIRDLSNEIFNFGNMCVSCVGNLEKDQEQRIREILKKEGYHS
jgi:predicted Zn-dependent peptidase